MCREDDFIKVAQPIHQPTWGDYPFACIPWDAKHISPTMAPWYPSLIINTCSSQLIVLIPSIINTCSPQIFSCILANTLSASHVYRSKHYNCYRKMSTRRDSDPYASDCLRCLHDENVDLPRYHLHKDCGLERFFDLIPSMHNLVTRDRCS